VSSVGDPETEGLVSKFLLGSFYTSLGIQCLMFICLWISLVRQNNLEAMKIAEDVFADETMTMENDMQTTDVRQSILEQERDERE